METRNPLLRRILIPLTPAEVGGARTMTLNGTIHRAGLLLIFVTMSALWTWSRSVSTAEPRGLRIAALACFLGAPALAWVTVFKMQWSPITAPAFALLEGLVLGDISGIAEARYPGIAIKAVALTFTIFFSLLFLYRTGIIRVTEKFSTAVVAATMGVGVFYLASFALYVFFGVRRYSVFAGGAPGIIISAVIVIIAAMNLLVDFKFIELCAGGSLPKYMEWFTAFGLIVALVWLYTEILKMLSKAQRAARGGR